MKYFHLIWAALFRHKARTFLTLVSIITAFLLFGMLDTVRVAFTESGSVAGSGRLIVSSKMSMQTPLPESLGRRKVGSIFVFLQLTRLRSKGRLALQDSG